MISYVWLEPVWWCRVCATNSFLDFFPEMFDLSLPGCGHSRLAELEDILSHDMYEPVHGRVALWGEVEMILQKNPELRTTLVIPDARANIENLIRCELATMIKTAKRAVATHRHHNILSHVIDLYALDGDYNVLSSSNPLCVTLCIMLDSFDFENQLDGEHIVKLFLDENKVFGVICDLFQLSINVGNYKAAQEILNTCHDVEEFACFEAVLNEQTSKFAAMLGETLEQFEEREIHELDDWQEFMTVIIEAQEERVVRNMSKWRRMLHMFKISNYWWKVAGEGQHCANGRGRVRDRKEFEEDFGETL